MKVILLFLLVGYFSIFPVFLSAQETGSCVDTIPIEQIPYNKAVEIIGIAVPSAMIVYGALSFKVEGIRQLDYSIRNKLLEDNSMWHNGWDNYLQFSPAVAAFGMKLGGVKSVHQWGDMAIIYAASNLLAGGIVYGTKIAAGRERPDGSNNRSFPSGHTETAFVAAEFLHQEYKNQSAWVSVSGYGMAALIGVSRIYNNKHWLSDVVAGAGVGILSTKIVYWSYPYLQKVFCKKEKQVTAVMIPTYYDGKLGLGFTCLF